MIRYDRAFPSDLTAAVARQAPAVVPWGALEWHGDHLPLGLDGHLAEAFAERLARALDGVLLPTQWTPLTTLPHPTSLDLPTEVFVPLVDATLDGLVRVGFRRILLITGHYAQGHLLELGKAATRAQTRHPGLLVWAATPLEPLGRPELLDHAGQWETAQALALFPDRVRLDRLPPRDALRAHEHAVLGADPRDATEADGVAILDAALEAWTAWVETATLADLAEWTARREADLRDYRETYGSLGWEAGVRAWWAARLEGAGSPSGGAEGETT